ncbi:coiled-coil domain-containing protein 82 [Scyliorhinus canicula]|uniref:coiled-coil domain-containing protein 82 n=1 Tax=Scyliorhinus canicula TaxID=7830 RepID=UPI0018F3AE34|nr:coiled-coil domain-containing protein 82 [Scyliorhinus canicula]
MATTVVRYKTRARTSTPQCLPKARIDRRRTRMDSISLLCDTDEEEESACEESEEQSSSTSADEEIQNNANKAESSDEDNVIRRKRLCLSIILTDSDSSSESFHNPPVRKIKGNSRRIYIQDVDEGSEEEKTSAINFCVRNEDVSQTEKELAISRKRKRQMELERLSKKKQPHCTTSCELFEESEEDSRQSSLSQVENTSDTEWENDSLKDFIVFEEKEPRATTPEQHERSTSLLAKHLPKLLINDLCTHFRRVIKALVINAFDGNFLKSLYEGSRKKKYAQEMLKSLDHFDGRCIETRLVNLRTTSKMKKRYQERVDCYPDLHVKEQPGFKTSCQACELQRYCRFTVILSGQLYDSKSLEQDSFMSNDKQVMVVGRVCAERTEVYHRLKHFKYNLYQHCRSIAQNDDNQDENVKDSVSRVYEHLEEQAWIEEQYTHLETILNDADNFCEEKLLD